LKYLRSATFGSKDIVIIKTEFVAKTQFLYNFFKNNGVKQSKCGLSNSYFSYFLEAKILTHYFTVH